MRFESPSAVRVSSYCDTWVTTLLSTCANGFVIVTGASGCSREDLRALKIAIERVGRHFSAGERDVAVDGTGGCRS